MKALCYGWLRKASRSMLLDHHRMEAARALLSKGMSRGREAYLLTRSIWAM